ncbi:MAG: hypothetical protein ACFCD0_05010 [Gemmataceae bacterium]
METNYELTFAGAIVMFTSISVVICLATFCLVRVLTLPPTEEEFLKGPLEIDTGDTDESVRKLAPQGALGEAHPEGIKTDNSQKVEEG